MDEEGCHEIKIRVRYKDTDRMGVVYYGNYLTFFEVGRAEYMRSLGYPYSHLEAKGYQLVVTEAAAKYYGNVGYDAQITVKTTVTDLQGARMRFDYHLFDEGGHLLVHGHTVHACINSNLKPVRIPADLKEILQERVVHQNP